MLLTSYNYLPVDYRSYFHDLVACFVPYSGCTVYDEFVYVPRRLCTIVATFCADWFVTYSLPRDTKFFICTNRFTIGYRFSAYYYSSSDSCKRIYIGSYHFKLATEQ